MEKLKNSKYKKIIIGVTVLLVVLIAGRKIVKSKMAKDIELVQYYELTKGDIENSITTSGKIVTDSKVNIYTDVNLPIKEIHVKEGDSVKEGDLLATLDISSLEKDLKEAKLNYKSTVETTNNSIKDKNNSISNAAISLKGSEISLEQQELQTRLAKEELVKAEKDVKTPYDTSKLDMQIEETKLSIDNKSKQLELLNKEEKDLSKNLNEYDDSSYKKELINKSREIERKEQEYKNIRNDIYDIERQNSNYDSSAGDAKIKEINREIDIIKSKINSLKTASDTEVSEVTEEVDIEQSVNNSNLDEIKKLEEELAALEFKKSQTEDEIRRERDTHRKNEESGKSQKIKDLRREESNLKSDINNLERDYRDLPSNLKTEKEKKLKENISNHEKIKQNIKDLEYDLEVSKNNYRKALLDKELSIEDHLKNNTNKINDASKKVKEQELQLKSQNNSLDTAKNNLKEGSSKTINSTAIDLSKLGVDKIEAKIKDGKIIASTSGVITEVLAQVGSTPSGNLFVIEDLENVHIKAKIKEYNLNDVGLGQATKISTLIDEDEVVEGKISFISPKATSAEDSSTVEFDIYSSPNIKNEKLKVGLNSILKIVIAEKKNVYKVPLNLIVEEGAKKYIIDENENKIKVELGIANKSEVEITGEGLKDGLKIKIPYEIEYENNVNSDMN